MDKILELNNLASVIVNHSYDAVVCYVPYKNPDGEVVDFTFVYLNDAAEKVLGKTKDFYLGNSFLTLFPSAASDGMFAAFKRTYETEESNEDIYYYEDANYRGWYRDTVVKYNNVIIVYFRDVTESKQREIELANLSEQLKKSLDEKELLMREINHRIKNNLQIISSILNMQSETVHDESSRNVLSICRQRINTIASIHNNLFKSSNITHIEFASFIQEIIYSLDMLYSASGKKIILKTEIDEFETDMDTAVNIAIILNELITNSFKHAFNSKDYGEINVLVNRKSSVINLMVSDNGFGFPEEDPEKKDSLGFKIIYALIDQMKGSIQLNRTHGTSFYITLPV